MASSIYFRTVNPGRKSCPACKGKLQGREVYSLGLYKGGSWRTVELVCSQCFDASRYEGYNFKGYRGCDTPSFLTSVPCSEEV